MSKADTLTIQQITRETDLRSVPELIRVCYAYDVSSDYCTWKYFDNPAGDVIGFVAISEGKIVSFYGVIPEWYWLDGRKELIFQSMDTMTHPSFQRLGLFSKLAALTYEEVRRRKMNFSIIGFPSPSSYPGFVGKLSWRNLFFWKYLFCYQAPFRMFFPFGNSSGFSFRILDDVNPELSKFLNTRKPASRIEKYLDHPIFEWKIMRSAHRKIVTVGIYQDEQLVGYCLYTNDTPATCQIICVHHTEQVSPGSFLRPLISHLFSVTQRRCIYCWQPMNLVQRKAFRKAGFFMNPFALGPFHYRFPFIVLHGGETDTTRWNDSASFDFQGIMLD